MPKTVQEIFDIVDKGLAAQGFQRSMAPDKPLCVYRAPNGYKCAAGHLIADSHYHTDLENIPADNPAVVQALVRSDVLHGPSVDIAGRNLAELDLIQQLQRIHDGSKTPSELKARLYFVAGQRNLTVPEIDKEEPGYDPGIAALPAYDASKDFAVLGAFSPLDIEEGNSNA